MTLKDVRVELSAMPNVSADFFTGNDVIKFNQVNCALQALTLFFDLPVQYIEQGENLVTSVDDTMFTHNGQWCYPLLEFEIYAGHDVASALPISDPNCPFHDLMVGDSSTNTAVDLVYEQHKDQWNDPKYAL